MLWNCFSSKGPGSVVHIHGIMDSRKYLVILNQNLAASAKKLKLGSSNRTTIQNTHQNPQEKWLDEHKIKLLPWPSQQCCARSHLS